jgi:hypothetical protein
MGFQKTLLIEVLTVKRGLGVYSYYDIARSAGGEVGRMARNFLICPNVFAHLQIKIYIF